MADLGSPLWSEIDASNNATPPNGFPEGMQPSDVNNSARAEMGGEKRWYDRANSTQTTTGTNTAYVLTYTGAQSALYNGFETSFVLNVACGATPTLNIDGLGARTMRKFDLTTSTFIAIAANDFLANQVLRVRYNLADDRYDVIAASFWPGAYPVLTLPINLQNALNETAVTMGAAPTMDIGAAVGNYIKVVSNFSAVVTISIATPAVVTAAAHGLLAGAAGSFATTGALPTGLVAGTTYYIVNPTTNTFQVALTAGGTAINTSGSQSGTQSFTSAASISAFDTIQAGTERVLEFGAALTLVHNATSFILPTGTNVSVVAGDVFTFRSEGGGNWRCTDYLLASGRALVEPIIPPNPLIVAMCKATGTTINKQYNVSSVVKNSTGNYTFNFAANIDANAILSAVVLDPAQSGDCVIASQTVSAVTVATYNAGGGPLDYVAIYLSAVA